MPAFRGLAASMGLLVGVVACGSGSSTNSTPDSSAKAADVTLVACPDRGHGLYAVESSGHVRWTNCDDSGAVSLSPVSVADGQTYVVEQSSDEPTLVALDADDGSEMWRFPFSSLNEGFGFDAVYASDKASFAGGGVIVLDLLGGTGVDHVGLDAATGEERWRVADDGGLVTLNTDELVVTSVGFGGDLAGSGPTGPVAAYDRRTGEQQWRVEEVPYFGGAGGARLAGDTMVVQLYADAAPGGVMGIDLATGEERWRDDDVRRLWSAGDEAVVADVGGPDDWSGSSELVALDPADGTELWRMTASSATAGAESSMWINALVDGSVVAALTDGHVLVGLDAGSGRERWRHETSRYFGGAGAGNALFFEPATGLELIGVDDGSTRWTTTFSEGSGVAAAAFADDLVVFSLIRMEAEGPTDNGSGPAGDDPAARSVGCAGGSVLTGGWIPSFGAGEPVFDLTVLLSDEGSDFCVINSAGVEDVVPFEPGRVVSEAEATVVQGTLADYLVVAVPSSWGQNPQVSAADGQQLSSATTGDGNVVLVIDYAPVGATPDQYIDRRFTFTGSEGQTLAELTVSAPPTPSMPDLLACLADHGVHVAPLGLPDPGPLDPQPLDPAVSSAAWTACRSLVVLNLEMSGQTLPDGTLESMDCMASKGFIQMFSGGEVDAAAQAEAWSECSASLPLGPSGLRCDVYTFGADGVPSTDPVRSDVGGFGIGAEATAPTAAATGNPITVTIPEYTTRLIGSALGYEILEHRDFLRTFTVSGATIVPGSLVQDHPSDGSETTATETETTVMLGRATPVAGGGEAVFPSARFDIVASAPGTVTIAFAGYDSTMTLRSADGVETPVRTVCETDHRVLATIAVS